MEAALYQIFWPVWYGAFVCWALGQGLASASVHKEHGRTLVKLKLRQRLPHTSEFCPATAINWKRGLHTTVLCD